MAYQTVELEHHHDGKVALIRLNRPDKLNSFNGQLIADLQDATSAVAADPAVRVVVLTGAGRGFSAGADLSDRGNSAFRDTEQALMEGYYPSIRNITTMPKPVIAAVNGPAAGAGSAFAMAPDLCVMADSAYVMLAFSNIALVPDCGATWLLSRAAGYRRAYEAAIEAQKVDAEECLRIGLANKVVPAEQVRLHRPGLGRQALRARPPRPRPHQRAHARCRHQGHGRALQGRGRPPERPHRLARQRRGHPGLPREARPRLHRRRPVGQGGLGRPAWRGEPR